MFQADTTALLLPREVGLLLGISPSTLKRLTAAGELPHVQVTARRPRYRLEDITAFIAARRAPSIGAQTRGEPVASHVALEGRSSTAQSSFASSAETGGGDASG